MIPCPHCGHDKSTVREVQSKTQKLRRYRICKKCGKSFTTEEFLAVFAGQSRGLVVDKPPGEGDG
jgi:transcriptional regulator NrdR family protein